MELDDPKLEMEVKMGIDSANRGGKRILFPKARRFYDLFLEGNVIKDLSKYSPSITMSWALEEGGECFLSSFCMVSGTVQYVLDVVTKTEVDDVIEQNMLMSKDYIYNFEIIAREGGTALVTCNYNRILGDRWFAIIDAKTIPGYEEALAQEEADEEMVKGVAEDDPKPAKWLPTLNLFGGWM